MPTLLGSHPVMIISSPNGGAEYWRGANIAFGMPILVKIDVATNLMDRRLPEGLDSWFERAPKSGLIAFQRFAVGLRDAYKAVKAVLACGPPRCQLRRLIWLQRPRCPSAQRSWSFRLAR